MANTIKTKYGTVINTTGLNPQQIAKVQQTAEANGAYGSKAAALADAMRKRMGTQQAKPTTPVNNPASQLGEQAPPNLRGKARADWYAARGVQSNKPADVGVDVGTGKNGAINEDQIMADAPQLFGTEDLLGEVDKVRDANYSYLSRDFAQNKQQEMEAKKQELANRGIPYSDDPSSPYGMAMKAVDQKYTDLDAQARQQAIAGGNDSITAIGGLAKGNFDSFLSGVLGMSDAELKKYGIDEEVKLTLKKIAAEKEIARARAASGGSSNDDVVVGGAAPGF